MTTVGDRIKNVTGKEHCPYCCRQTTGYVVYDRGNAGDGGIEQHSLLLEAQAKRRAQGLPPIPTYEAALAPCPFCEAGYGKEFPKVDRVGGAAYQPPWPNGFWQGRDTSWLEPDCDCDSGHLSNAENIEMVKLMVAMITEGMEERSKAMRP